MTDVKTRTIRRRNDSRIGENPIRAFAASVNSGRKKRIDFNRLQMTSWMTLNSDDSK